jgi:hypothetical protein
MTGGTLQSLVFSVHAEPVEAQNRFVKQAPIDQRTNGLAFGIAVWILIGTWRLKIGVCFSA